MLIFEVLVNSADGFNNVITEYFSSLFEDEKNILKMWKELKWLFRPQQTEEKRLMCDELSLTEMFFLHFFYYHVNIEQCVDFMK